MSRRSKQRSRTDVRAYRIFYASVGVVNRMKTVTDEEINRNLALQQLRSRGELQPHSKSPEAGPSNEGHNEEVSPSRGAREVVHLSLKFDFGR